LLCTQIRNGAIHLMTAGPLGRIARRPGGFVPRCSLLRI